MKTLKRISKNVGERGIVLPLVLTFSLIFAVQITGLSEIASHTQRLVQSQQNHARNFYLAEAAVEKAIAALRLYVATNGVTPDASTLTSLSATPNTSGSGVGYTASSVAGYAGGGSWTQKVLTAGDYAGLNASTQTINIQATATDTLGGVTHRTTVNQTVEVQLIPIFQFGVFYENDLEILPGASMTFAGPVHTNGDLYLGVGSGSTPSLTFDSTITANGTVLHERKDGGPIGTGAVNIKDNAGVYKNMNLGAEWLDSDHANWTGLSQTRWDGNVKSVEHGVKPLTLPLPSMSDPHALIEPRSAMDSLQVQTQKMDYKSQLRIIDGVPLSSAGAPVELRYCSGGGAFTGSCPSGQTVVNPIASRTFYNYREGKTVASTDIDIAKLNASPAFTSIVASNNGVVLYVSDRRNLGSPTYQDSVRLVNGSMLPVKGLTVASENPMYVKGDYNTVNKQPAGLVTDAFNILSNSWNDSNSTNTNLTGKTASATTVHSTVITGNTDTSSGQYNGGFENIHRLHEKWTGVNLTFKGSVMALYSSQYAVADWLYGGNFYTAPNRVWSFDTDLSNPNYSVPGLPSVFNITKVNYEAT